MNVPTIFDLLSQFDFLRGTPAAALILALAMLVLVIPDWRIAVLALAGQYLFAGLLFADVLDARLAALKVIVGLFVCLILYLTARQVNWGRLPADVRPEEVVEVRPERRLQLGRYELPVELLLRLALAGVLVIAVWTIAGRPGYRLPLVPEHFNLAVYALAAFGLAGMGLTSEPLRAGQGMLTFALGFELFYAALEPAAAMLLFLAVANLTLALVTAYLAQARYAFSVLVD